MPENMLEDEHIRLLERVNNAKTEAAHTLAEAELRAWRDGVAVALDWGAAERGYLLMLGDQHYIDQGLAGPMCGGVHLDWKPAGGNA